MEPESGRFMARERARRLAWGIERVLQERRLAWRGAEVGMAALREEEAAGRLARVAQDARSSARAVREGRLRDREQAFLEAPFVVVADAVARRVEEAARLEAGRARGETSEAEARRRVEALLAGSLARLGAFAAAAEAGRSVGEVRPTDLGRLLREAEEAVSGGASHEGPAATLRTDPHALADLLGAVAEALPPAAGPWRVVAAGPGRPLALHRGRTEGTPVEPPEGVRRAAAVLSALHPVDARAWRAPQEEAGGRPCGISLRLPDPAGERLDLTVPALAGEAARLHPGVVGAVRSLLALPALEEGAPVPPERLVAVLGLLGALDAEVRRVLGPRLAAPAARAAAAGLPREATRRAPLRRHLLRRLEALVPGLAAARASDLAAQVASGRLAARALGAAEAALVLALLGEGPPAGRALDLAPLGAEDVEALRADLGRVARIRRDLEASGPPAAGPLQDLEAAALAALGRLGRL